MYFSLILQLYINIYDPDVLTHMLWGIVREVGKYFLEVLTVTIQNTQGPMSSAHCTFDTSDVISISNVLLTLTPFSFLCCCTFSFMFCSHRFQQILAVTSFYIGPHFDVSVTSLKISPSCLCSFMNCNVNYFTILSSSVLSICPHHWNGFHCIHSIRLKVFVVVTASSTTVFPVMHASIFALTLLIAFKARSYAPAS